MSQMQFFLHRKEGDKSDKEKLPFFLKKKQQKTKKPKNPFNMT